VNEPEPVPSSSNVIAIKMSELSATLVSAVSSAYADKETNPLEASIVSEINPLKSLFVVLFMFSLLLIKIYMYIVSENRKNVKKILTDYIIF
jgi:hypothetical protein